MTSGPSVEPRAVSASQIIASVRGWGSTRITARIVSAAA
jgi:hypothetical protein